MIRCLECENENEFGAPTCAACGKALAGAGFPLGDAEVELGLGQVCPKCDRFAPLEAAVCPTCETSFEAATPEETTAPGIESPTSEQEQEPAEPAGATPRPPPPPKAKPPPPPLMPLSSRTLRPDIDDNVEPAPYAVEHTAAGSGTAPHFKSVGVKDGAPGRAAASETDKSSFEATESRPRVRPIPMPKIDRPPEPPPVTSVGKPVVGEPRPRERRPNVRPFPLPKTDSSPAARPAGPSQVGPGSSGGLKMADPTRSCHKCGAEVPASFLFCGRCGAKVTPQVAGGGPATDNLGQTQFFGQLQAVGKAKLVLIKGEGIDGISYQLNAKEHVAGRSEGVILFPDDRFLSPRHANFYYKDTKLFISDESSVNGVFLRIREPFPLSDGDAFLVGEELLRFEVMNLPRPAEMVSEDGTVFYGTPIRDGIGCRVVQILLGGRMGMVYVPSKQEILIGREACDLNFPRDRFISGRHSKLQQHGETFHLSDMGSKNGTYVRLRGERELKHGDYVFLGQQLFRVEITAF